MSKLPERYADLEAAWGEWIIATEPARAKLRLAKSDEELRAFYDAVQPRLGELIAFLDGYSIDAFPPEVKNLWWLVSSYIGIAVALELYGSAHAIPGGYLFAEARSVTTRNALELLR